MFEMIILMFKELFLVLLMVLLMVPVFVIFAVLFWVLFYTTLGLVFWACSLGERKCTRDTPPFCSIDPREHPAFYRAPDGKYYVNGVLIDLK